MKRFRLLAWPLVLCYFGLALTVLAKDRSGSDNVRLRVSIRKDTLRGVSSCHHTFSQIELLNTHTTENIMIHSIQTAPEETILIRSVSGEIANSSWENIPQQLHVSRLPSGSLSLGPGQVAIVPVTFLPRYPDLAHDNYIVSSEASSLPVITSASRADLIDLVGGTVMASFDKHKSLYEPGSPLSRRRSNLEASSLPAGDEFEVRTSIVVDSSRGVLQVPISASSVRQNPYAIPDVIRFHHSRPPTESEKANNNRPESSSNATPAASSGIDSDGTVFLNSVTFYHQQTNKSVRTRLSRRADPAKDCYDIYVNNPSLEMDLEVSEILVSRPDLMSVEFDPAKLLLAPDLLVIPQHPSQVVREWTEEGPMYVPADSVDNYIATVCTAPNGVDEDPIAGSYLEEMSNWIDSGNPEQSLGFLQIRTDIETLFISLERFVEKDTPKPSGKIEPVAPVSTLAETLPPEPSSSLLKATPDELNFRFLSSASPPASASIALQNKSPVPIRIMRVSASFDGRENKNTVKDLKRLGLQLNITQGEGENSGELPAAGSIEDAILITCQTNPDLTDTFWNEQSSQFRGSIIVRGTMDTELEYDEWKEEMIRDPYRDIHVTLEIPLKIAVLNGRVEVTLERSTHPYPQIFAAQGWDRSGRAVSNLFFPLTRFDALEDSESPLPTQKYMDTRQIGHDLRIMTNMEVPLKLESAEIVDENNLPIDGTDSPCGRFNVSRARPFEPGKNYPDFENLGFLALQYKFDIRKERDRRTSVQESTLPTTCFLNIVTSPADTGIHRIPLIVFPAELEITSPSRVGTRQAGDDYVGEVETIGRMNDRDSVFVGYEKLLGWFRSSSVGQTFLDSMRDKRGQSDSQLLSKYIRNLLDSPDDADLLKVQPILVRIGAIEHGEISKAPLIFTNHNPIPVTLTVDVGEVEGMSIELGRDGGHGLGDSSNIFDFLPKEGNITRKSGHAVLKEGSFEGHPVLGLRQFLLSDAQALSLSQRFPFRDAVYMSKEAVEKQPSLRYLYKWHSYAEFHRSQYADSSTRSRLGDCASSILPPEYESFVDGPRRSKQPPLSGPMMISDDKKLLRPLNVCSDRESSVAEPHQIKIPPGGTVRFEIKLRSPPLTFLESDISQLLATGLILSSNFGQTIPVFATFEALQGQLHLWKTERSSDMLPEEPSEIPPAKGNIISVPLELQWRWQRGNGILLSDSHTESNDVNDFHGNPAGPGIPLLISSSFSRDIRLLEVESCNPWFHVTLQNSSDGIDVPIGEGTRIGVVQGSAFCLPDKGDTPAYPSFFQCVINWLSNRHELQPPGCGSAPVSSKIDISMTRSVRTTIQAFEKAIRDSRDKFEMKDSFAASEANSTAIDRAFYVQPRGTFAIKSGRKRSDGYIDSSALDTHAEAWTAWHIADGIGLTDVSSNLRATIQYKAATPDKVKGKDKNTAEYQSLSLSMQDLEIQSTLSAPKLFSSQDDVHSPFTQVASFMNFPATLVGNVVSMKIPLRNPTSVPVRVRLSAAPLTAKAESTTPQEKLKDSFMQGIDSPYVQSASGRHVNEPDVHHLWWNGGGAFVLVDDKGDVMQSHHNISIKAGAGAHVSLVSPSLHSISAFLLGCGARCGVREDAKVSESSYDLKQFSTIGAAATASTTLIGRQRSALPQLNELSTAEPFIYAGGRPIPGSAGPQAFAIPHSSLDEIIIPPFGTGEIGPILFRPPGRSLALGCSVVKQSDASYWGDEIGDLCDAEYFSSMIFLENSLTGIERVELRGRGQWEHLYFLDPPPRNDDDAFGDIEMRNGRDTLVFSGSGDWDANGSKKVTPVIKQVFLHNGGDVSVVVKSVFLSDTSKKMEKSRNTNRASTESCRSGSFRLLDCWESTRATFKVDGEIVENMHAGFELRPGQSRSIHVEHAADCRKREEFVSLNVEFAGDTHTRQNLQASNVNQAIPDGRSGRSSLVQNKKVDLVVGYTMDPVQFSRCSPVNFWGGDFIVVESIPEAKAGFNATRKRKLSRGRKSGSGLWIARSIQFFVFSTMVALSSSLIAFLGKVRRQALERSISKARNPHRDEAKHAAEKKRPSQQSIWNATFRCLARADPTSPELQTLGREQIRQVVAGRYRAKGGLPPPSLANAGAFVRDRAGAATGGVSRQRTGKEGGGAERVRTLSDALFQTFSSEQGDRGRSLIPAGLGWRVAFARGIISDKSIRASAVAKATATLFEERSGRNGSGLTSEMVDERDSDSESDEVEMSTEIETQDEDEEEETSLNETDAANEVPELKAPDDVHGAGHNTPEAIATSIENWTQPSRKREEAAKHGDANQENGKKSSPRQPANEMQIVGSPSTSINSSESSSTNNRRKSTRKDKNEPQTQNKGQALGPTGSARVSQEAAISPRKQKGKKVVRAIEKTTESAPEKESPRQPSHKEAWGKGPAAANEKTTTLRGKDKKLGQQSEPRKEQDVGKSKRDKKGSDSRKTREQSKNSILPAGVSPPPGLAPPPGFKRGGMPSATDSSTADVALHINTGAAESVSLGDMLTAALNSDMNMAGTSTSPPLPFSQQVNTPTSDLLFGAGLSETPAVTPVAEGGNVGFRIHPSPPIGTMPTSAETVRSGRSEDLTASVGDPLLDVLLNDHDTSHNGFDVMDFLDGILDDGGATEQPGEQSTAQSSLLAGSSDALLTSNPWASERKSRAAAYGIAFDEAEDLSGLNSSNHLAPFPLLTPAAILMAGQDEDGDDDDRALSFYARLTADEE